jgi:hypothetical protein
MKGPITFTSGQLLDLIALLEQKEDALYDAEERGLAVYYMQMGVQLQRMYDRLQSLPGEQRVAELVIPSTEQQ